VRHGIEPSEKAGVIEIRIMRADNRLTISIRDTGPGLAGDKSDGSAAQNGIGIPNTRARLESLYPGQHHFSVDNAPAGGCVAKLEIPFHSSPSDDRPTT
jgi:two-component system sensor histidine kinase AlgZ